MKDPWIRPGSSPSDAYLMKPNLKSLEFQLSLAIENFVFFRAGPFYNGGKIRPRGSTLFTGIGFQGFISIWKFCSGFACQSVLECSSAEMVSIRTLRCSAYTEWLITASLMLIPVNKMSASLLKERHGAKTGLKIKLNCPKTILFNGRTVLQWGLKLVRNPAGSY